MHHRTLKQNEEPLPGWKNDIVGSQVKFPFKFFQIFLSPTGRKIKNKMCETGDSFKFNFKMKNIPITVSQIHFKIYSDFLLPSTGRKILNVRDSGVL